MNKLISIFIASLVISNSAQAANDWTQEAHDAQRSGFTPEEPAEPWSLAWTFDGPDANGGTNGSHLYNAPGDARTVTGGSNIYVPAGGNGLYALAKSDGAQAWRSTVTSFNATPAYDTSSAHVYAGGANGTLYKFNASNGSVAGSYAAGSALNKAVLLAGGFIFVVSDDGRLHKVNPSNMTAAWVYSAGFTAATPPSHSPSRDAILYCTDDLFVHAVNNSNGSQKWRVKPTPNTAGFPNEFKGFWPVIAEQHGVVLVRMRINHDAGLWGYPSTGNIWPNSNAEARTFLQNNPAHKNLFALNLDNGTEKFIPAVGYGGVEDLVNGNPYLNTGPVPVIKILSDGKEVAYQMFRNGQSNPPDGRWDSHFGEMVLDDTTIANYVAGDLRFIRWIKNIVITDEQCPVTMAGDTIFHAHWGASESAKILDRSAARGLSYADPITTQKHPTVIRRQQSCANFNPATHWTTCGLTLFDDGRFWDGPGFWVYWNVLDPPTPHRSAYSDGLKPRHTYVADGLVIIEGNGGDLMVLRHSGSPPPPPPPDNTAPGAVTNLAVSSVTSTSATLLWTSPGDDGYSGAATSYDARYSTADITAANFGSATQASGEPTPIAAGNTQSFTINGLSPTTTYFFAIKATDEAGNVAPISNVPSRTTGSAGSLPAPWQNRDVGSVGLAGSASHSSGAFTLSGSGADIWDTADAFHFVHQTLNGDGEIKARIATVGNTDPWAKAGVMFRESFAANAKHAFMLLSSGNGLAFQRRTSTGGSSTNTSGDAATAPRWVRLVRGGNTFTAYSSTNGSSWTTVGSDTISMSNSIVVGLAVTAHNNTALNTSTFDSVTVSASSPAIALAYNGSTAYASVNDAAALDIAGSAMTMEAWVKVNALPATGSLGTILARELGSSSGYALLVGDNGRVQVRLGTTGNSWGQVDSAALTWTSGTWYHVAASYDGTTVRIFRDGTQIASGAQSGTLLAGANKLYFGGKRYDWSDQHYLNGAVDEARLSRTARYTANFTAPTTPFTADSNTVGLWHFNENTGATTADSSGNTLTATLTGATWTAGKF